MLILIGLVKLAIMGTIFLYTSIIYAEGDYIRKLYKVLKPSQLHTVSTIQPLLISMVVIFYDLHIASPTTLTMNNIIHILAIQIFLLAIGVTLYENCEVRSHRTRQRISRMALAEGRFLDMWSNLENSSRVRALRPQDQSLSHR